MSSNEQARPARGNRGGSHRGENGETGEGGIRLQRVMAEAGVASRRDCEEMIERGIVEVNGKIVDHLPVFVDPATDRIVVDGKPLRLHRAAGGAAAGSEKGVAGRVYAMLHKPDRVLCTTSDEVGESPRGSASAAQNASGGRTTVTELVQHPSGARLYPAGRLDYHTTGLVLMTNDGALADRLTHARYGITRTYRVTIKGKVTQELLRDLRRRLGVERPRPNAESAGVAGKIAGGRRVGAGATDEAQQDSVRLVRVPGEMTTIGHNGVREEVAATNSVIEIVLREGKSRQLRAILEQMGALTRKLTRTAIGPLRLRGVAVGEWRDLTREEIETLMQSTGLSHASGGSGKKSGWKSGGAGRPGAKSRSGGGKRPRGVPPPGDRGGDRGGGQGRRGPSAGGGRGRPQGRGGQSPRGDRRS